MNYFEKIIMRRKTIVLIATMYVSLFMLQMLGRAEEQRPNFLVILCDDLGWGDLGCFGHPHIRTNFLDQLARDGCRLTHCYSAAPVCSPSRVGLMTGRSPNRAGIFDWIPQANENGPATSKLSRHLVHLRKQEQTLPKLLRDAGYATALSGKWHCNSMFNRPEQPQPDHAGFEHWFATQNNAGPSHENPENFVRNGKSVGALDGFSCQLVASEAINWLEKSKSMNPNKPFFLYVAFHEPHEPVQSPVGLVEQYRSIARNEDEAQYFANVHNMDSAVGRLLETLDRLKLRENTVVYFSSDNGPETLKRYASAKRSYGRPGELKGMKLWTHEAGIRVPGIIRWPGKTSPGTTISQPISSLDLLPTFCSLAQVATSNIELDGMDVQRIFQGQELAREKPLFWFYYNAINEQRAAMRDGRWKVLAKLTKPDGGSLPKFENISDENKDLVRSAHLSEFSLYDLESDPAEIDDLSKRDPQRMRELEERINRLYQEVIGSMHIWP